MIAIGTQLVGLRRDQSSTTTRGLSLNWLIQSNLALEETDGIGRDIREFLPEHLLYMIYPELKCKFENAENCIEALSKGGEQRLLPGEPLAVKGILQFPDVTISNFDPFSPPDIDVSTFWIQAKSVLLAVLKAMVLSCHCIFSRKRDNKFYFVTICPWK